jgi:hypothetical protein
VAHDVFISYALADKAIADAICEELEAAGMACWIAPRDVTPGMPFAEAIFDALGVSRALVLVFSSVTNGRAQVEREVSLAVSKQLPIVPFRVEDVAPSGSFEYYLSGCPWLNAFSPSPRAYLGELTERVQALLEPSAKVLEDYEEPAPAAPQQAPHPDYDVFISYRRELDAQSARLIRAELQNRGSRVFLDVDDLRPGQFDEALLERIRGTSNFVLILSPGSLDRCSEQDDWLRREVVCALAHGRTIIPVLMPGFVFPAEQALPEELHPIRVHHGVAYSHEYFGATMDKIVGFLASQSGK